MTISKLHLHVTNQCTSYCKHCSSGSGPHAHRLLTISDFQYILDWAYDVGVRWVELSGGEPLTLREDLFEIIEYAHHKPFYVSVLSNGCLLDENVAQRFRAVGVDRVSISIYGATADIHDDFTQTPHSFSRTLHGIQNIIKIGIESVVNVIVTPLNLNELDQLPSLLDGIDLFTFGSIVPAGRGASLSNYSFSQAGYLHAINKINCDFMGINHYFMISLYPYSSEDLMRFCMRPSEEATIDPEGYLIPCCVLPDVLRSRVGTIRDRDLIDSYARAFQDPVFSWLKKGHRSLRDFLHYSPVSPNLCSSCIDMCYLVKSGRQTRDTES